MADRSQASTPTVIRPGIARLLALSLLALSGCGGGGGGDAPEPPAPAQSTGLSAAPTLSTQGSLTLQQFDRDAKRAAPVSYSSRYTLIPEGATP